MNGHRHGERPAKVTILAKAKEMIRSLKLEHSRLCDELLTESKIRVDLMKQLKPRPGQKLKTVDGSRESKLSSCKSDTGNQNKFRGVSSSSSSSHTDTVKLTKDSTSNVPCSEADTIKNSTSNVPCSEADTIKDSNVPHSEVDLESCVQLQLSCTNEASPLACTTKDPCLGSVESTELDEGQVKAETVQVISSDSVTDLEHYSVLPPEVDGKDASLTSKIEISSVSDCVTAFDLECIETLL